MLLVLMNTGNIQVWQICLCVGFSSAFASLLDPAYKATLTDLLSEDEYAKASGMVVIASSSKFLISPIIGGLILTFTVCLELIIIIDILTLAVTVSTILFVRKSLSVKPLEKKDLDFFKDLKEGWQFLLK
ncbi:MFS transporter OS=Lysinibacillus sphaericus OX=1421 GN=LS41612_16910 PE=4 SV=1 [Lysinibacillus sphaericus]